MFRNELAKEIEKIERKIKELENKLDFVFSNYGKYCKTFEEAEAYKNEIETA